MKRFFLLLLCFIFFTGCKEKKKTALPELLFISNPKYLEAFPESAKREATVRAKLGKKFIAKRLEIKNFEGIERELEKYLSDGDREGRKIILFLEPFLLPSIINSSLFAKFQLKIISYGIGREISSSSIGLFHIFIPKETVFKEVEFFIQKEVKRTKKSPVLLLEEQSGISRGFQDWWNREVKEKDSVKFLNARQNNVGKDLEVLLGEVPRRSVFLFAGLNNRTVNMLNREKVYKCRMMEFFTRYGMNNEKITGYVDFVYERILEEGLNSKEFQNFLSSEDKKVVSFPIEKEGNLKLFLCKKMKIVRRK